MNRRDFIKASGAAAATTVFAQVARGQARPVSPNEKIRIGLIGCGGIGIVDLETFFINQEVECPIVCDIDDANLARGVALVEGKRGITPETVKDFRKVIDRNDLDAVLVATPDHWHALPMIYACQAGKDVYVEKPLGQCIEEGRAMLEAARANKRVVQMGTQWRSGEHYGEAVNFVHSGLLGDIRMVRTWAYLDWVGGIGNPPDGDPPAGVDYDMWLGPRPERPFNPNRFHFNFRWFWDYAGGLMTDWGVHLLNICLWGMGPKEFPVGVLQNPDDSSPALLAVLPKSVSSQGGKLVLDDNSETPDTQAAIYEFPGYQLIFEHQMLGGLGPNGRPHGMYFNGANGAVLIDDSGWEIIPERKKKDDFMQSVRAAGITGSEEGVIFPHYGGMKFPAKNDGRPAHVRNFLDCMRDRKDPVEHMALAHHVSTVAHLGNLALRTGSVIHWDAQKEEATGNPEATALVKAHYREPWTLPRA
jgi:predicted dehydrogenase